VKTFFIADPHFGHRKIIEYENRPFVTVEEMDKALIENWNHVVGKRDKVYLLGDISFYKDDITAKIVRRLNGIKYLILGNHDSFNVKRYYDMGFHRVYDYPIILDGFWMLSHEPLYTNTNMPIFSDMYMPVNSIPITVTRAFVSVSSELTIRPSNLMISNG